MRHLLQWLPAGLRRRLRPLRHAAQIAKVRLQGSPPQLTTAQTASIRAHLALDKPRDSLLTIALQNRSIEDIEAGMR
ncbi:MAG: hypothetical protein WA921_13080 [Ahrensia sp.]